MDLLKQCQQHKETGSLLSEDDIRILESFDDGISGYFGKMLNWLEDFISCGIEEGRFTKMQAREDLQIALWYSFACNNLDEYIYYYNAAEWMKDSEKNAEGCGTWYYRYSVALMYCGRLEEALFYGEKGAEEEPDYPWIWLQLGKLRAHFGNREGALEAAEKGLELVPGDYEFINLNEEINRGASIEEMEYHWINPQADMNLQNGTDNDAYSKKQAISCITVDYDGLEQFMTLFSLTQEQYTADGPFIRFPYTAGEHTVNMVFWMTEGGLSKLDYEWLMNLKNSLYDKKRIERKHPDGRPSYLDTVMVGLDYRAVLIYRLKESDEYFQIFLDSDGTEDENHFWSSDENIAPEIYTDEELNAVEHHIKNTFGDFDIVFHEIFSPDIHVDICVVPPSGERDCITLVTMGMGAHRMNVPDELAEYGLERAELAISLPSDWKLDEESMKEEKWYWPAGLLKVLARLPVSEDTWLGYGHSMDKETAFADNTELCAAVLTSLQNVDEENNVCILPGGDKVNFYQVVPVYRNELEYKISYGIDALLDKMKKISHVVHPVRHNVLTHLN